MKKKKTKRKPLKRVIKRKQVKQKPITRKIVKQVKKPRHNPMLRHKRAQDRQRDRPKNLFIIQRDHNSLHRSPVRLDLSAGDLSKKKMKWSYELFPIHAHLPNFKLLLFTKGRAEVVCKELNARFGPRLRVMSYTPPKQRKQKNTKAWLHEAVKSAL